MSILIKGMEMPIEYGSVLVLYPNGEVLGGARVYHALAVPPHGDLKDADALMCEWEVATNANGERFPAVSAEKIQAAPTIIPASEEGE